MLHSELIPARERNSKSLMIMLHGLGDSMEGYRWMPEALDLPWMNYLLVNAPDAYYGGFSWFNYPDDMTPGIIRSRKLLLGLLDELGKKYPADQITIGGFSQGCLMSIDVGFRYPHRLAAIVGISGWVFEIKQLMKELSPVAKQQRLLMTHGPYDPLIPFDEVKDQAATLKASGINVEWREFPKAHTIYGNEEIAVIREFVRAGYSEK